MALTLLEINELILSKKNVAKEAVLESLVIFYKGAVEFSEKTLNNDTEALNFITEDMARLGQYIPTVGLAKAIAKSVLENRLSNSDYKWRKNNLPDYKQSSKSSTTHQINLRGMDENHPFTLISELLTSLYFDMNTKFKALQSVAANLKFGIEHELWSPVIKKKHE